MNREIEQVNFRRGRELFILLAAFATAVACDLVRRGDWQALLFALLAIFCIAPIRERRGRGGPAVAGMFALIGVALWLAIRYGMPSFFRGLA